MTYTLMREGNAKYGETYNGIHYDAKYQPRTDHQKPGPNGRVPGGQGVWDRDFPLDPYVVPGDPDERPVAAGPGRRAGQAGRAGPRRAGVLLPAVPDDERPIACPIAPPAELRRRSATRLVARFIAALPGNRRRHGPALVLASTIRCRTTSGTSTRPRSAATCRARAGSGPRPAMPSGEKIAKEHENYHRGLLHFLATDPRVPEKVRERDAALRPAARRVHRQRRLAASALHPRRPADGVRPRDDRASHVRPQDGARTRSAWAPTAPTRTRFAASCKDGVVIREGKTATGRGGFGPYPIGYGAIVPKPSECENLLVTFALSASHTAFSSIRMEPVFMATSQSAATAACLAIDDGVPVQQVDYDELRKQLLAAGLVLKWPPESESEFTVSNSLRQETAQDYCRRGCDRVHQPIAMTRAGG